MDISGKTKSLHALWWVLGGGFLVRLALALANLQTLLALSIPDDAFYYFKIAENIASGRGSTFDGIHPTNGYHPLWMGFLIPFFRALPGQPGACRHTGIGRAGLSRCRDRHLCVPSCAGHAFGSHLGDSRLCAVFFQSPHGLLRD